LINYKKSPTPNIGLAKNWLTENFIDFCLTISFSSGGRIKIWPVKEVSTFEYKFNFGFGLTVFKYQFFAKPRTLTGTSRFCPKKFVKDFFVPKKQKHEMRLTNGLAKNRRTEIIKLLFCYFASVPAEGLKFNR